jgi:hypothetical protein
MKRVLAAVVTTAFLAACGGTSPSNDGGTGGGTGGGATGGGGGATGGGSGGGSGGGTGGGATGGGGGTAMPLTINLNYQSQCPGISPQCGGDVVGRWFYTAACVDGSVLSQALQSCPTATVSNITGTTKGDITFSSTTVNRVVTTTINATLNVPTSCAVAGCGTIQTALGTIYDSVTCTANGTGCGCTITDTSSISDGAAYTTSNGVVSVNGGALTYAYCRTGNTMVYRQTSTPMSEPGTLTLEKQ